MEKIFDKIFLINLKRDKLRLELATTELKKIDDTQFEIFEAVDGKDVSRDIIDNHITYGFKNIFSKNSLGAYMSHFEIWQNIVNNEYDKVLILEDDIRLVFEDDVISYINTCMSELPDRWDILLIGNILGNKTLNPWNNILKTISKIEVSEYSENLYKNTGFIGLHSAIISNSGAKKLVENLNKIYFSHDVLIRSPDFDIYSTKKIIFIQDHNIGTTMSNNKPSIINNIYKKINLSKILSDSPNKDDLEWISNFPCYEICGHKLSLIAVLFFFIGFFIPGIGILYFIIDIIISRGKFFEKYYSIFLFFITGYIISLMLRTLFRIHI